MVRDPRSEYPLQHLGDPVGQFETDARTWSVPMQSIVEVLVGVLDSSRVVTVEATKPDPRLSLELFVGFVPAEADQARDLDFQTTNGQTIAQNLAASLAWLALLDDFGGGVRESENIVGTSALPVPFIDLGLWGVTWEDDLDSVGVRARLTLFSPGVLGRWMVGGRWTAVQPMSQRDWEHARQNMRVNISPRKAAAILVAPIST